MICRKFVFVAPAALAALSLAACGGSGDAVPTYCPSPFTVTDAGRLTHFKDGPGRDPRDIAYEAVVAGSRTTCEASRNNQINVTLLMRISVSAGPAVGTGPTRVPYFVRVIGDNGAIVQGQESTADFRLSAASPRGSSQEELSLFLPQGSSFRIAIGLKPTAEELNYNRRGRQ